MRRYLNRIAALALLIAAPVFAAFPVSEYRYGNVNVGTSAVSVGSFNAVATNTSPRKTITIWNNDTALTIYCGNNTSVTTSTGFPVPPKQYIQIDDAGTQQWSCITTATGPASTRFLETF